MENEIWYTWKQYLVVDGETAPRFITPRSDPHLYEMPFDLIFNTPEEAVQALTDWEVPEDESELWFLVKMTLECAQLIR